MRLSGTDEAQQRAKSLIEELFADRNNAFQSVNPVQKVEEEPAKNEQPEQIDFTQFDWTKANEEYVRSINWFIRESIHLSYHICINMLIILSTGRESKEEMGSFGSHYKEVLQGRSSYR